MKFVQMPLNLDYGAYQQRKKDDVEPHLDGYILDDACMSKPRPAVIICPGGGYACTSLREGEPIALKYAAAGFQAFVLWYSVAPSTYPVALLELAASVKMVRDHATEWNIDPNHIVISGFSAGGHLAGSLACHWDKQVIADVLHCENEAFRPNGAMLFYPVITSGDYAHKGSFENLLHGLDQELWKFLSLEEQVGSHTPPTFLWHTYTDGAVPVENTLFFISALRKAGVSCEAHIFKEGHHGLALANRETATEPVEESILPNVQPWIDLSIGWVNDLIPGGAHV